MPDLKGIRLLAFDFDGVFTDNAVYVSEDGRETVRCSRADGLGLSQLRAEGIPMVVISTETNPVVSARCAKLRLPCHQACGNKLATLRLVAEEHGVELADAAFVGNDINDLEVMKAVGYPIAVADAYPRVLALACWRTDAPGGHGAVREVCERILKDRRGG